MASLEYFFIKTKVLTAKHNCKIPTATIKFTKAHNVLKNLSFNLYKLFFNYNSWSVIFPVDRILIFDFFKMYFSYFFSIFVHKRRGSEFSSYEIELRNRVTQKDVTLRVTNSRLKNKKLHFELQTRSRKIKSYTSSY